MPYQIKVVLEFSNRFHTQSDIFPIINASSKRLMQLIRSSNFISYYPIWIMNGANCEQISTTSRCEEHEYSNENTCSLLLFPPSIIKNPTKISCRNYVSRIHTLAYTYFPPSTSRKFSSEIFPHFGESTAVAIFFTKDKILWQIFRTSSRRVENTVRRHSNRGVGKAEMARKCDLDDTIMIIWLCFPNCHCRYKWLWLSFQRKSFRMNSQNCSHHLNE